jgi:hypothetical protein
MSSKLGVVLAIFAALATPGALAQPIPVTDEDDTFYYREPPLSLPQGINGVLRASASPRQVGRVDTIAAVFQAVRACWRLPAGAPSGQQITVRLALKRSGEILGRPQITYYRAGATDNENRERFTGSVREAFATCLPLPVSPTLGSAIAGRPFTFRFIDDRPT